MNIVMGFVELVLFLYFLGLFIAGRQGRDLSKFGIDPKDNFRILAQAVAMLALAVISFTFSKGMIVFYIAVFIVGIVTFIVALTRNRQSKKLPRKLEPGGFLVGGLKAGLLTYTAQALVLASLYAFLLNLIP